MSKWGLLTPSQTTLTNFKDFANDYFKFDVIGGKFSERVEKAVGKGEIVRFPTTFSKDLKKKLLNTCISPEA